MSDRLTEGMTRTGVETAAEPHAPATAPPRVAVVLAAGRSERLAGVTRGGARAPAPGRRPGAGGRGRRLPGWTSGRRREPPGPRPGPGRFRGELGAGERRIAGCGRAPRRRGGLVRARDRGPRLR